jgi:hypothetical protein
MALPNTIVCSLRGGQTMLRVDAQVTLGLNPGSMSQLSDFDVVKRTNVVLYGN